jgi:S1-C subfamily serine protease
MHLDDDKGQYKSDYLICETQAKNEQAIPSSVSFTLMINKWIKGVITDEFSDCMKSKGWKQTHERDINSNTTQSSIPQPPKSKNVAIVTGTGFLFGSQDYIITNYHVVKGTIEVTVKFLNGESINAEVIATDTQNDVAVLKLTKSPDFQSREMKFGDSSRVRMGDKVFTIGYPSINIMGFKPKYTEGVISAVTGIKDNPTVFQTTVPIQPGNSGGPLFNDKGEVVGLTTSSLSLLAIESMGAVPQSVNYAVKSSFVKKIIGTVPEALLSNRGIVVVPTESNSRADFIEAISKNVVLIVSSQPNVDHLS